MPLSVDPTRLRSGCAPCRRRGWTAEHRCEQFLVACGYLAPGHLLSKGGSVHFPMAPEFWHAEHMVDTGGQ